MPVTTKIKVSIRFKLFLLVLVAFSILIVTTNWQIGIQANKVATKSIEQSLKQAKIALSTKIESRFTSIKEVATGIAKDGRVLPLVYDADSLTLQDLGHEFKRVLEFDVLFFTDESGTVLARSDRPEAVGQNMAGKSPLFDKALSGAASRGVIVSQGKFLQIVVIPIFDNVAGDLVRGTVALGYEFSNDIAEEIHALTNSDIGFFVFSRDSKREVNGAKNTNNTNTHLGEMLDDFFTNNSQEWKNIYQSNNIISDVKITVENEEFHSVVHQLANEGSPPLGFVMALRSRTELLEPFIDIQRIVIFISIACLIGASIFAWFFSLRISRPIIELVSLANNIQEGTYPSIDEKSTSNDEVGLLYDAVVTMGSTLKEKAELENYLSQMADELNISESVTLAAQDMAFDVTSTSRPNEAAMVNTIQDNNSGDIDETIINTSDFHSQGSDDKTILSAQNLDTQEHNEEVLSQPKVATIIDARYKIIRHIGVGAMGTVYLAHDLDLDENVAIKVMAKELFSRQESINVKEEIRLARQITHRNIIRTFDFGSWESSYYITMEYVSGYDLGELLKNKGAFNTHIGVIMARQICSAMNAAHEQGIIHRDLKPSNMMINRQGILKIMDFGLAMKVSKSKKESFENLDNNESITIAGTPRYMAPEQFYNWQLDERTDIYAIGIILYAIFTGAPPFSENNFDKLAELHLTVTPPSIRDKDSHFPLALQDVIFKSLAKKPEDRYPSVREILDALNTV